MYEEPRDVTYVGDIADGLWRAIFFEAAAARFGPGMSSAVRNLVCKG